MVLVVFIITPIDKPAFVSWNLKQEDGKVLVYGPGLNFKLPIIERVIKIDHRLQSFDVPSTHFTTDQSQLMSIIT